MKATPDWKNEELMLTNMQWLERCFLALFFVFSIADHTLKKAHVETFPLSAIRSTGNARPRRTRLVDVVLVDGAAAALVVVLAVVPMVVASHSLFSSFYMPGIPPLALCSLRAVLFPSRPIPFLIFLLVSNHS